MYSFIIDNYNLKLVRRVALFFIFANLLNVNFHKRNLLFSHMFLHSSCKKVFFNLKYMKKFWPQIDKAAKG